MSNLFISNGNFPKKTYHSCSSNDNEVLAVYNSSEETLNETNVDDPMEYGKKLTVADITVHHFCLVIIFFWMWNFFRWFINVIRCESTSEWWKWTWSYLQLLTTEKRSETSIKIGWYIGWHLNKYCTTLYWLELDPAWNIRHVILFFLFRIVRIAMKMALA